MLIGATQMSEMLKEARWKSSSCYDGRGYYLMVGWKNGEVTRYLEIRMGSRLFYQEAREEVRA